MTLPSTGKQISVVKGVNDISLRFPYLGLAPGLYHLKMSLTTEAMEIIAGAEMRLHVKGSNKIIQSMFYQPYEWDVTSENTPALYESGNVN